MEPLALKLSLLDNSKAPMIWCPPASSEDLDRFETLTGIPMPFALRRLLLLTNGAEINVPGTRFYTLNPVYPTLFPHSLPGLLDAMDTYRLFEQDKPLYPLGVCADGARLFLDRTTEEVVRWEDEQSTESLRWPSLEDYLEGEISACIE